MSTSIEIVRGPQPKPQTETQATRTRGAEKVATTGKAAALVATLLNMDRSGPRNAKTNPKGSDWTASLMYVRGNGGWIADRTTGELTLREVNDAGLIDLFTQLTPYLKQEVLDGVTGMPQVVDPLAEKKASLDGLVADKLMTQKNADLAYAKIVEAHAAALKAEAETAAIVTKDAATMIDGL